MSTAITASTVATSKGNRRCHRRRHRTRVQGFIAVPLNVENACRERMPGFHGHLGARIGQRVSKPT